MKFHTLRTLHANSYSRSIAKSNDFYYISLFNDSTRRFRLVNAVFSCVSFRFSIIETFIENELHPSGSIHSFDLTITRVQAGFSLEDSLALKAIAQLAPPVAVHNSNQKKPKSRSSKAVAAEKGRQTHVKGVHNWNDADLKSLLYSSSEVDCEQELLDSMNRSSVESSFSSVTSSSTEKSRSIANSRMSRGTSLDDVSAVSSTKWVGDLGGIHPHRLQAVTASNGRRMPAGRLNGQPLSVSSSVCEQFFETTMAGNGAPPSDGGTLEGSRLGQLPATPATVALTSRPVVAVLSPCAVHFKGTATSPETVAAKAEIQGSQNASSTESPLASLASPPGASRKMPSMVALPHGAPRPSPRLPRAGRSPLTNANSASRLSAVFDWEP